MNLCDADIEPKELWTHFQALNAIPRPSKKEDRIRAFMVQFGKDSNLETSIDDIGNVLICKPASVGMENRATVVLQSHLDMVHQKNGSTIFDFDSEGIRMYIEGDWVKADGTTLGADNGIGVAAIMMLLASNKIPHPPLEALFTIDEETGMTGALNLQKNWLKGKILLNLDTEEDDEIDIGCAGGIDVTATGTYTPLALSDGYQNYSIRLSGLQGGHSGMDIHKGLGNSNKLINRILYKLRTDLTCLICSLESGGLRNAIPREGSASVAVRKEDEEVFIRSLSSAIVEITEEYYHVEPNLKILWEKEKKSDFAIPESKAEMLIKSLYAASNGVYKMSDKITGLVETSNNIARVSVGNGSIKISCLTRSSSESSKLDLANSLKCSFELAGLEVAFSGSYPGWSPTMESPVLKTATQVYKALFGKNPKVVSCHAGLECGIIGSHYPDMDMISFGPTIKGAHSPDERVHIPSVKKFMLFLTTLLAQIPTA